MLRLAVEIWVRFAVEICVPSVEIVGEMCVEFSLHRELLLKKAQPKSHHKSQHNLNDKFADKI